MAQKSNFIVRGGADFSNINKSLTKTQKKFGIFQSSIGKAMKAVVATLSTVAIGKFIKDTTQMAMTVESSMDNINRNMGSSSKAFSEWANNQAKSFGIARKDAYSYGSTFSNLLGSFQSDSKETAQSTQELMQASAIIASKTGRTYDDVADRIRSGMLGSTEAIEDLGVYTNISMIESTEAFKKFANGKSWSQLDFKVQQQIRLAAILEQTYSRYGNTLANTTQTKQAMFLASLNNIKLNIGQAFLPIYNVVLPALTTLANALETITGKLAVLSETFFGKSISIQSSAIDESTSAIENLGNEAETAGKKAKKSIAPFDELNQIGSNSSSGSSTTSGVESASNTNSLIANVTDKETGFTKWLSGIKKDIEPTIEALNRLKDALKPLGEFVFNNLKNLYNDFLKPVGKWVVGEGLPRLLDVCTDLLKKIDWTKLTDAFKNFYKALAPFSISVGRGLISFIETIGEVLKPVISTTVNLLSDGLNSLAKAIDKIPPGVAEALGGAIGGLATSILIFEGATQISSIVTGIKGSFSKLFALASKHPILTIAAAFATLAGAVISFEKAKFDASPFGKYIQGLQDIRTEAEKVNSEVGAFLEKSQMKDAEIEAGALDILKDKYFELSEKASLTNDEQALMIAYAQELTEKVPELNELIDSQTGYYKGTREEIEKVIGKTKEYYLLQAAQEELTEIAKEQYKVNKSLKTQTDARKEAQKLLNEKQKEYNELLPTITNRSIILTEEQRKNTERAHDLCFEIASLEKEIGEMDTSISETKESQNALNKEWDYASGYIAQYSSTGVTEINKVDSAVKDVKTTLKNEDIPGKAKNIIKDFNSAFKNDTSTNSILSTWLGKAGNLISNFKMPNLKIGIDLDASALKSGIIKYTGQSISAYATGGFPSAGELFIGNENGIEMMGRMGNSNVVANNNQIVDGIRKGVADGNTEQITLLKQQNALLQGILQKTGISTKDIFNATRTEANDYRNRTGKNAFGY